MSMAALRWARSSKANRKARMRQARAAGTHTPAQWQALVQFCGGVCLACRGKRPLKGHLLTRDHIVPLVAGGSDSIENLQPLCVGCNAQKRVSDWGDLRPAGWRDALEAPA